MHSHHGILLHAVFKISSLILGEWLDKGWETVQPLPDAIRASQVAATLNYARERLRQSLIVPSWKAECKRCRHPLTPSCFPICHHSTFVLWNFSLSLLPFSNHQQTAQAIFSSLIRCHRWPLDFPNTNFSRFSLFSVHQGITNDRKRKLEQQLQSIMVLNRQFEHVQNFINWAVCSKTSVPFLFSKELVRGSLSLQLV